jgi:hypothetical protein
MTTFHNDPVGDPPYGDVLHVDTVPAVRSVLVRWNQPDVLDDLLALTRGRVGAGGAPGAL